MKKKWIGILLAALLVSGLAGCGDTKQNENETVKSEEENTRVFTDSAGREVTLPKEIGKLAPSGPLAQVVLYTAAPDQLCGLSIDFPEDAKNYIDEKYWGLPKFGQFYGKNASLNMEALLAEAPDVIVDIGEAKENISEDMDALSEQLGIPVVFIEATLPTMETAYEKLGELTGNTEQTDQLAEYCADLIEKADNIASSLTEEDKKTVYFAMGNEGLNTNTTGSIHADVIEQIGAVNAAKAEAVSTGGGNEVSLEQIFLWNPDIILADSQMLYDKVTTDSAWQDLDAVKNGKVYKVPSVPYSFMNNPPSVNRLIGILWLGNLVYPELYQDDVQKEITEFYELFYHLQLQPEDMDEILKNAF